jgi:hypothetical protein
LEFQLTKASAESLMQSLDFFISHELLTDTSTVSDALPAQASATLKRRCNISIFNCLLRRQSWFWPSSSHAS